MPASPRELTFASLFAYLPRGESETAKRSRRLAFELKRHGFTRPSTNDPRSKPQIVSDWIAERIRGHLRDLPFAGFFGPDSTLVPMPTHARREERALWVPMSLCEALAREGLGGNILPCIVRSRPVPKAALARPDERPTVEQHLTSMSVERTLEEAKDILLVDDVVTRGATFMAAMIRVLEAFPAARVRAFAVMRTISGPESVSSIDAPCVGKIILYESGKTHREP